jgi:hypothetical protein
LKALSSILSAKRSILSSHSGIKDQVKKSWLVSKDIIRRKLQSLLSTVHISLDAWTSPNNKLFLAICSHFVDCETERLTKALIGLPSILSHHADIQLAALLSTLRDYGICAKLGVVISDNASSNDKLCRLLGLALADEVPTWEKSDNRIRCNGHIINLAVQAFLFQEVGYQEEEEKDREVDEVDDVHVLNQRRLAFRNFGPLGKLHNIVVHTRGSTTRINQFVELAGRKIPLDQILV